MDTAEEWTRRYLALPHTQLKPERRFVVSAFTIKSCMGTILSMAQITACLTLSRLRDEGLIAFCESGFLIIPAVLRLRRFVNQQVFLHSATFPHNGMVTCAHYASPRRRNGRTYELVRLVRHYESDYGAATNVAMLPPARR